MGIRFFCPNGHKLNVKEQQAGQRGKCPKCGVKLLIPLESTRPSSKESRRQGGGSVMDSFATSPEEVATTPGPNQASKDTSASDICHQANLVRTNNPVINFDGPVQHDPMETEDLPHVIIPSETESLQKTDGDNAEKANPLDEEPSAIWYVKPPEGGQYGPAEGDIMRQWIDERRIHPDSDLWREGWSEWEKASIVFPVLSELFTEDQEPSELDEPLQSADASSPPPSVDEESTVQVASAGKSPSSRLHQKATNRETRLRTITIVIVMTLSIILLGGTLLYVLVVQ